MPFFFALVCAHIFLLLFVPIFLLLFVHGRHSGTNPLSHVQSVSFVENAGAVLLLGQEYISLSPGQYWLSGHGLHSQDGVNQ